MTTLTIDKSSDAELCIMAQSDPEESRRRAAEEAICKRYRDKARFVAREFRIPGIEPEDKEQECMIGMLLAIRDWRPGAGSKPLSYIKNIMRRRMIDLYRQSQQVSEVPSRVLKSLDDALGNDPENMTVADTVAGPDDTHASVWARIAAMDALELVSECSSALIRSIADGGEVQVRVVDALVLFADVLERGGWLRGFAAADVRDALLGDPKQVKLFDSMVSKGTPEAQKLIQKILPVFLRYQAGMLAGHARGARITDIAQASSLPVEVVSAMLSAVRVAVGAGGNIADPVEVELFVVPNLETPVIELDDDFELMAA